MEELHKPVLLSEVLDLLAPRAGESYLDLTAGYGGHADGILEVTQNYKDAVLVDRDKFATEVLSGKYESEPVKIVNEDFYSAALQLIECGKTFDMILADYGVSSVQLDEPSRGFSFTHDGPLDMRMDRQQKKTAAEVVNHYSEEELIRVLTDYGEERPGRAKMLASAIVAGRPWNTTRELAEMVKARSARTRMHPATRVFQAIRIEVNDELGLIERTLPLVPKLLAPGGRVAFITFHSLEDRLVKRFLVGASSYGEESELQLVNRAAVTAGANELVINPRARSAKLRVARKTMRGV